MHNANCKPSRSRKTSDFIPDYVRHANSVLRRIDPRQRPSGADLAAKFKALTIQFGGIVSSGEV